MFGRHVSAISRIQTTTIKPAAFRHASFSRTIHPKLRTRIRSFTAATTFVSFLDIGFSVTPRQLSTAIVSNLLVVDRGRRTSSYNCFSHRTSKSGAPRRFTQTVRPSPLSLESCHAPTGSYQSCRQRVPHRCSQAANPCVLERAIQFFMSSFIA